MDSETLQNLILDAFRAEIDALLLSDEISEEEKLARLRLAQQILESKGEG